MRKGKETEDMKKVVFIVIYSILVLGCLVLVFNYGYNAYMIYRYNQHDYTMTSKPMEMFNWTEPYVAYYNQGNIYFQNEDYLKAMQYYEKALEENPPEDKECAIRINAALTILYSIESFYDEPEYIDYSISMLQDAKDVLLEKECATDAGDGHSEAAQKLKDEIDTILEKLEEMKPEELEEGDESNTDKKEASTEQSTQEDDAFEEDVKKAIQEKQSKANQERQESLQYYKDVDKDFNIDADGKIW